MNAMARRMFELVEPIGAIPYSADEPNETMFALGFTNYWDTYFAGRAAPLGLAPAEVVDALFYNFAPGEVARHIPKVWRTTTPEAAIAARRMGCATALRRILVDHVDSPAFARATELLMKAATSAPTEGRPMYAALLARALDDPRERPRRPSTPPAARALSPRVTSTLAIVACARPVCVRSTRPLATGAACAPAARAADAGGGARGTTSAVYPGVPLLGSAPAAANAAARA